VTAVLGVDGGGSKTHALAAAQVPPGALAASAFGLAGLPTDPGCATASQGLAVAPGA
jgi:N-acetylglucosamine kinase-like BadF-type ATPase